MNRAPTLLIVAVVFGVLAGGCASNAMRVTSAGEPERDPFAADEAVVRDNAPLAADESAACPDRCHARTLVCEASERICEIARRLDPHDESVSTQEHCQRASTACSDARDSTASCACR